VRSSTLGPFTEVLVVLTAVTLLSKTIQGHKRDSISDKETP
jgi:hypothetical protein